MKRYRERIATNKENEAKITLVDYEEKKGSKDGNDWFLEFAIFETINTKGKKMTFKVILPESIEGSIIEKMAEVHDYDFEQPDTVENEDGLMVEKTKENEDGLMLEPSTEDDTDDILEFVKNKTVWAMVECRINGGFTNYSINPDSIRI